MRTKQTCCQCGRRKPLSRLISSVEDRMWICRSERACTLAYHRRELNWGRRVLSMLPFDAGMRLFMQLHRDMLARREARP